MRKIVTLSAVAAASLLVAACGGSETATTDNATVTEMNAADAMEGTTNDSMTNMDAATATGNMTDMNSAMNATDGAMNATGNMTNAM
jgi:hypothetical protein